MSHYDYPHCTKLFMPEISETCEYRAGSRCWLEGLICAHVESETIFSGVEMAIYLKAIAEIAALKSVVRELATVMSDWSLVPKVGKILKRADVRKLMEEK